MALQPPANATLAEHVGDLGGGLSQRRDHRVVLALLLVLAGHSGRLSGLGTFKPAYALGGHAGAGIVAVALIAGTVLVTRG